MVNYFYKIMENIFYKNKVLYRITFNKKFFHSLDNVENIFSNKFNMIELKETKTQIIAQCYKLIKSKEYKESIFKRIDENFNNFVKLYYIDLKCINKEN